MARTKRKSLIAHGEVVLTSSVEPLLRTMRRLKPTLHISLLLVLFIALQAHAQLRHGDLLFVAAARTTFESAISSSTAATDTIYSHVAIVDLSNPTLPCVIEAEPREGVRRVALSTFLAENADSTSFVVAKRLTVPFDADGAVDRARALIGRSYDRAFLPGDEAVYCSELVWLSYLGSNGQPLFEATSMHFGDPTDAPGYWRRYYQKLGTDVPEGLPGTHPSTMARSPILVDVNY